MPAIAYASTCTTGASVAASTAPERQPTPSRAQRSRKMVPVYDPVPKEYLPSSLNHLEKMERHLSIGRSMYEVDLQRMEVDVRRKREELHCGRYSGSLSTGEIRKVELEIQKLALQVDTRKKNLATMCFNDKNDIGRLKALLDVAQMQNKAIRRLLRSNGCVSKYLVYIAGK